MLPQKAPVTDGLRLGQQWVQPGASWDWLCQTWEKLPAPSHRNHPCSSPATKTWVYKANALCSQSEHKIPLPIKGLNCFLWLL